MSVARPLPWWAHGHLLKGAASAKAVLCTCEDCPGVHAIPDACQSRAGALPEPIHFHD